MTEVKIKWQTLVNFNMLARSFWQKQGKGVFWLFEQINKT